LPLNPNPYLKKLGFSETDRVVVIHADDIGMSHATLPAMQELLAAGIVSSAAIMVPCRWFEDAAILAAAYPEADFGVHLTLNAEWRTYRWGPISTSDPASGLMDRDGYFFNNTAETRTNASHTALRAELDAQLTRARQAGVRITHADTHMFCLGAPEFFPHYVGAALEAGTLPVLMRPKSQGWSKFGSGWDEALLQFMEGLETQGIPMMDNIYMMNLDTPTDRLEEAKTALDSLPAGFTHFIIHPAIDSPELRSMAPDWRCRVADLQTFKNPDLQKHIDRTGVQVIGYEILRKAMPG